MLGTGYTNRKAQEAFQSALESRGLSLTPGYFDALLQTAQWLVKELEQGRRILGMSGAQGTGKSTFSWLLAEVLKVSGKSVFVASLDDFYLTKQQRRELKGLHPLLETRGVPGTHDLDWCLQTVAAFREGMTLSVPVFSKSEDDRSGERDVDMADVDLLIFEGWCWGARPQQEAELAVAINNLEAELDPDLKWREYVNLQLQAYQQLFQADLNLMLKAPDFDAILGWRWQQEQGLPQGSASMTYEQVSRFIQFYQRISENLLKCDQSQFDVVIQLDSQHCLSMAKFPS